MNATISFNNVSILQCSFSKRGNKQIQQLSTTVIICRSVPTSLDVLDIFWMVTGPIGVSWLNSLFDCCYFYWLFVGFLLLLLLWEVGIPFLLLIFVVVVRQVGSRYPLSLLLLLLLLLPLSSSSQLAQYIVWLLLLLLLLLWCKWEVGIPRPRAQAPSSVLPLLLIRTSPTPLPPPMSSPHPSHGGSPTSHHPSTHPSIPRVNQYICPNRYSPRCMPPHHLPDCACPVMNNKLRCYFGLTLLS